LRDAVHASTERLACLFKRGFFLPPSLPIALSYNEAITMFLLNPSPQHTKALTEEDAETLGVAASAEVQRFFRERDDYTQTSLYDLPSLSQQIGVESICVKDESTRMGLGSFKALGGS
jgi:hypothetical protein